MPVANISNRQYNPPDTVTRTSHSIRIVVDGNTIGLINSFSPRQSRTITPIYELNVETSGIPYENVPGNVTGLQIDISRYDLWVARMEQVFGSRDLSMLSNQQSPFTIEERWVRPDNTEEVWQYVGCWLSNVGRTLRSDDQRIVNVQATVIYLYKQRVV
jgi:hypothetical protein